MGPESKNSEYVQNPSELRQEGLVEVRRFGFGRMRLRRLSRPLINPSGERSHRSSAEHKDDGNFQAMASYAIALAANAGAATQKKRWDLRSIYRKAMLRISRS